MSNLRLNTVNKHTQTKSPYDNFATAVARLSYGDSDGPACAYLVGGYVRDMLLGLRSSDVDIEVYGLGRAKLDALIRKHFSKAKISHGPAFGTWQVTLGLQPQAHINLTAVRFINGYSLGISIPRTELRRGQGHRGFTVKLDPNLPFREALKRRDFTVNAILLDPLSNEIIDPFKGAADIAKRILRPMDAKTFPHDPLRAWRAVQMIGRFGLKPTPQLTRIVSAMAKSSDQKTLSNQRVRLELEKLFASHSPISLALTFAFKTGLLRAWLPELENVMRSRNTRVMLLQQLDKLPRSIDSCWKTILKALGQQDAQALIFRFQLPKKWGKDNS